MTDADRIITLRRSGFDNHTIAAMLDIETQDVRDALAGLDPLPSGGGGGAAGGIPNYETFALSGSSPDSGIITPQDVSVDTIVRFTFSYDSPGGVDDTAQVGLRAVTPDESVSNEIDYVSFGTGTGEASVKGLIPAGWKYEVRTFVAGAATVNAGDIIEYPYNWAA